MTTKRRIKVLECQLIEPEIARIDRYYDTISEAELDLICAIAGEVESGEFSREYSVEEIFLYNRHVDTLERFSSVALVERTRRIAANLVATGAASQAEIDEIFDTLPLRPGPKVEQ